MYCPPEYFEKDEYHGKQAMVWSPGVLLFASITRFFPDSSNISLMDADVWFQQGFSDGKNFITTKKRTIAILWLQWLQKIWPYG